MSLDFTNQVVGFGPVGSLSKEVTGGLGCVESFCQESRYQDCSHNVCGELGSIHMNRLAGGHVHLSPV